VQTVMICTLHQIFTIQGQSMKEDEMSYVCSTSGREGNAELIRKSGRRRPSWRTGHSGKYNIKMHSKESGRDSI